MDTRFCRARVSEKGECAGRSRWGAVLRAVAVLSLQCRCFGPCFPSVRAVASRGAHAALIEVFPESELQAGNSGYSLARVSWQGGAGTGLSQSKNGGVQN